MSKADPEIKEHSIVLIGRFNPVIFHPHWLLRKGLIGETLADAADINLIHKEVSEFTLENYKILVTDDRFVATSVQEMYFDSMKDLVIGIFECLPEVPIIQVGINFHQHYAFSSDDGYIQFGHNIVPKEPLWNSLLPNPGLDKIVIQGDRTDDYKGKIRLYVQVSSKIKRGVEIQVNDHYDLYTKGESEDFDASRAISLLKEQWQNSITKSVSDIEKMYHHGANSN